jgi:hypothetical protein
MRKVTISLPAETLADARKLADAAGIPLADWLAATLTHTVRIRSGLAAMDEWERDAGPISAAETAWASARLAEAEANSG